MPAETLVVWGRPVRTKDTLDSGVVPEEGCPEPSDSPLEGGVAQDPEKLPGEANSAPLGIDHDGGFGGVLVWLALVAGYGYARAFFAERDQRQAPVIVDLGQVPDDVVVGIRSPSRESGCGW